MRARLSAVQTNQTILYDSVYDRVFYRPNQYAVKIWLRGRRSIATGIIATGWSRLSQRSNPMHPQAGCDTTTQTIKPTTKVKEQCHGSLLQRQRAVSHASWPCKQRPIRHRLAAMSGRPSVTPIAWAMRSFASRRVGPLTRADGPPTGHAGPMSGPAGRPTASHALSGRDPQSWNGAPISGSASGIAERDTAGVPRNLPGVRQFSCYHVR